MSYGSSSPLPHDRATPTTAADPDGTSFGGGTDSRTASSARFLKSAAMGERQVVVLSEDMSLRGEVEAAVAGHPGVRAVFADWERATNWPTNGEQIVVIDDEGQAEAAHWVETMKARERSAWIIYLAARHSIELERQVRQAGASYYAAKSDRSPNLSRVIDAFLRAEQP